jgi:hypothetical protein
LRMDIEGPLPLTIFSTTTPTLDLVVSCIVIPMVLQLQSSTIYCGGHQAGAQDPILPSLICNTQMAISLCHGGCENSILLLSISAAITLASSDQIQLRAFACSSSSLDLSSLKRSELKAHPCSHYG